MTQFDKKVRKQMAIKATESVGDWSFERPETLIIHTGDNVNSILMTLKMYFPWFNHRWNALDENHQAALLNIFHDHPQMMQHIWDILVKNFDKDNKPIQGHWVLAELEFVLMEKLGLLNDDIEVEVYRKKEEDKLND